MFIEYLLLDFAFGFGTVAVRAFFLVVAVVVVFCSSSLLTSSSPSSSSSSSSVVGAGRLNYTFILDFQSWAKYSSINRSKGSDDFTTVFSAFATLSNSEKVHFAIALDQFFESLIYLYKDNQDFVDFVTLFF